MENLILKHRAFVAGQIEKSFNSDIQGSESDVEKAKYQVGQPHPNNPNILWTEWQPGKFDWKSKNGRYWKGKTGGATDNSKEQKFKQDFKDADETTLQKVIDGKIQASDSEKKWAKDILDERKGAKVKDTAAKKVIDLLTVSSSKYTDIKKVVAFKTDKGNWAIDYDGANTGLILNSDKLSEKDLKDAGVKIEKPANDLRDKIAKNTGLKKYYDEDSNETWYEGKVSGKRVRILQETVGKTDWWNVEIDGKFIKNSDGNAMTFQTPKEALDEIEETQSRNKKADSKQDKIAQNAGFKDYEEMRGYQNYVTSKNLLKKSSMQSKTKEDTRKKLEAYVAKYEKEHADVIKRVTENKGAESKKADKKSDDWNVNLSGYKTQPFEGAVKVADLKVGDKLVGKNGRTMTVIGVNKTKDGTDVGVKFDNPRIGDGIHWSVFNNNSYYGAKKAEEKDDKKVELTQQAMSGDKSNKSKDVKSLTSSVQDAYSKVYNWIKEDEENGNPHSNGGEKILDYLQNIEGNLKLLSQGKASDDDLKKLQDDVKSLSSAWDAVGYGKSNLPISKEDVTKLIASKQKKDVPFKDLTKCSQVIDYAKTIDGADFEEIDSEFDDKGSKAFRLKYNGGLKLDVDFLNNGEYVYTFRDNNDNSLYEVRSTRETNETNWSVMLNPRKWGNLVKSNISKHISQRKAEQTRYFNSYNRRGKSSDYDRYLNAKFEIERLNRRLNKVDKILQLS